MTNFTFLYQQIKVCWYRFLMLLFFSCLVFPVYSQLDSTLVTIDRPNIELIDFLTEIENQTSLKVFYKAEWLKDKRIRASYHQVPVIKILESALPPLDMEYRLIDGRLLIILPENEVKVVMMQLAQIRAQELDGNTIIIGNIGQAGKKPLATLTGKVFAGNTGESIPGATIQVDNTSYATASDINGSFNISMKPGLYKLIINSIAYEQAIYTINLLSDGAYDFEVFEQVHRLNEVNVYAERGDRNVTRNQMSLIELDHKNIRLMTAVAGEKDILKGLTRMPGVQSAGEFGSGINVRGGGEDQNLYLIDDAPVFNTAHVFGLLSVLNPDAVKSATLYKGHIPVEYGERVSSVMDIKLAQNHVDKTNVVGGVGLYSSRLMVKVPVIKDKVSVQIGGRSSYSDWLLQKLPDYNLRNSSAGFYDLNATVTGDFKKDKFSLTLYSSRDKFRYINDFAYRYGNNLGSFSWTHILSPSLTSKLTVVASNYGVEKDETSLTYEQSTTSSDITYTKAKTDFTYTGISHHTFRFGLQGIRYDINPGKLWPLNDSSLVIPNKLEKEKGVELAVYLSDTYEITNNLTLQAGIRATMFYNIGPKTISVYEPSAPFTDASAIDFKSFGNNEIVKSHLALEPRASLKYLISEKNSVKMSYNRNVQNAFLVASSTVPTPDNIWKLSDKYFEPMIADQIAIGYYHNLFNNLLEFSTEVYYKQLKNIPDYRDDATITMNPYLERDLTRAKGTNYGVEVMIKKNVGRLEGLIGYTYSRSFRQTNTQHKEGMINNNNKYRSPYDKPHDLNIEAIYNVNRRLRFSGNFSLASGRPVTLPEYKYNTGRDWVVVYSDRNEYRLPTYHRLDLSVSLDESLRIKKKWKGSWTFTLMNVYARKNPYSVFYSKHDAKEMGYAQVYTLQKLYFIGKPLPTLTYNFIF